MTKNIATNYDAGHRWKSHADFNLICLPYNCKLYLFKHVYLGHGRISIQLEQIRGGLCNL